MSEPPGISHGTSQFDDKQPLKLAGTLTKVEWNNPRIWYYLDVKNPDGTTTTWGLSGGAPGQLMRRGTRKDLQAPWSQEFEIIAKPEWEKDGCSNTSVRKTTAAPAESAAGRSR